MPDRESRQDRAVVEQTEEPRVPASGAPDDVSAISERPLSRVSIQRYLEALKNGVTLSS